MGYARAGSSPALGTNLPYPRPRTVMIPTDPCHSEEQISKMICNIEVAARYAFGEMASSEIESRLAEFKDADKIDPRIYDTDVAAYGLGHKVETTATL